MLLLLLLLCYYQSRMDRRHVQRPTQQASVKRPLSSRGSHVNSLSSGLARESSSTSSSYQRSPTSSHRVPPTATPTYPALSRSSTAPPIHCTTRSSSSSARLQGLCSISLQSLQLNDSQATPIPQLLSCSYSVSSYSCCLKTILPYAIWIAPSN
jgi:hypothetical protein